MNTKFKRCLLSLAISTAVGISAPAAYAQTSSGGTIEQSASAIDDTAAASPTHAAENMAKEFAPLVGSEENSLTLIEGLKHGTPVTLGDTTETVTITPSAPTGYGNVFATLALAQTTLAAAGITSPTTAELNAALTGGTVTSADGTATTMPGILTLRAAGMSWGQIAKQLGVNLGRVVSGIKSGNERLAKANRETTKAESRGSVQRVARTEKAERSEKVERAERAEKVDRPERPEKVERPERPEKVERPERPEKIERGGRG